MVAPHRADFVQRRTQELLHLCGLGPRTPLYSHSHAKVGWNDGLNDSAGHGNALELQGVSTIEYRLGWHVTCRADQRDKASSCARRGAHAGYDNNYLRIRVNCHAGFERARKACPDQCCV